MTQIIRTANIAKNENINIVIKQVKTNNLCDLVSLQPRWICKQKES